MSVLVYIESSEGKIKNSSREAVSYGALLGDEVVAVCLDKLEDAELSSIGKNGATKVYSSSSTVESAGAGASAVAEIFRSIGANTVLVAKSIVSSAITARLAIKIDASIVSNVVALPDTTNGYVIRKSIFTGNAFAMVEVKKANKILSINKNTVELKEDGGDAAIERFELNISADDSRVKVTNVEKTTGKILLPEADLVVSGGRGLKGPENWGMIEDLADALGAATGCSKPVSDMDWRPHSEHVGQTGIKVSPTLYIAIGISGAIQHLAGVNSSKYLVVINTDEEAPFFKAADYGMVADAFEVVPKLTEAIKALQ